MNKLKVLTTVIIASTCLVLSACGGGSDSAPNNTEKPSGNQTPDTGNATDTPNNTTKNFVAINGNDNLFPNCVATSSSQDPSYLKCMSAIFKGKNPAGENCLVDFNGDTLTTKFTVSNNTYTLFGTDFKRSIYSRTVNNGAFALQMASLYYNNDKSTISTEDSEVRFQFNGSIMEQPSTIDLKYNSLTSGSKTVSCILSSYKTYN